ncbi:MAG: glycerol-3-phosphate acyltransferase [Bacteroidetes bacterium]|nr:glycerol-3-phosphate acyltransferase [Bacteroidota bacterium]
MNYILCGVIGYLLGSFPTAFILLKKFKSIDIREQGSTNIGALNSFRVSKSKLLGVLVLLIDMTKGAAAVWICWQIFGTNFLNGSISLFFAVLAHNYSPWLKFKGGRGLATTAGGALLLSLPLLLLWLFFWVASFLFRRNIQLSSIMSTVLTTAIIITSYERINSWSAYPAENPLWLAIIMGGVLILIMTKHIEPLKNYLKGQKQILRDNEL